MTEEISAESFKTDKILSSEIARGPWPHESCGCRPPENALPPFWTCPKCNTKWPYKIIDGKGYWIKGV